MGCFWGAERRFWQVPGVWTTAVGYQGGVTPNPTYEETCTGMTGHTEAVRVGLRPQQESVSMTYSRSSGRPMTPRRASGKATTSGRSTARRSTTPPKRSESPSEESVAKYQRALTAAGLGDHHHRGVATARRSTTPRTTTSSTSRRFRTATTATPTPESPTPPIIVSISPLAVRRGGGGGHLLRAVEQEEHS